jgi:hypothetical protein
MAKPKLRKNADEGLRRLERAASRGDPDAVAALEHRRKRLRVGGEPVIPRRECYTLVPYPGHPEWVTPTLDGKAISTGAMPLESAKIQIDYDIGERAKDPSWYAAIDRLHYPRPECWEAHFPPPRYLHPRPRRRVRTPTGYRVIENPGNLREFLAHAGGPKGLEAEGFSPALTVVYGSGGDEDDDECVETWRGSLEGWKAFARKHKPEVYSWDLSLARPMRAGGSELDPEAPAARSLRLLRDYGWGAPRPRWGEGPPRPMRRWRRNPGGLSPELALGHAARILASDPARLEPFLERLGATREYVGAIRNPSSWKDADVITLVGTQEQVDAEVAEWEAAWGNDAWWVIEPIGPFYTFTGVT